MATQFKKLSPSAKKPHHAETGAKTMTSLNLSQRAVLHIPRYLKASQRICVFAIALAAATPAFCQTDRDTVRWDDRSAQWVYTLYNPADASKSKEIHYTPRTLIEPRVKSSVRWDKDAFEYRYRISNGNDARQPISSVSIRAPKWDASAPLRPEPVDGETGAQMLSRVRSGSVIQQQFVNKTVFSSSRWSPFLNVNRPTRVVFGWLVNYDNGYQGIEPRKAQGGFSVLRTELPGAAWVELQGDTPDIYNASTLPRSGAVADHATQVLADDSVYVPAMVPAIVVPNPYNGAELARRIKAHVATWVEAGLMDAERLIVLAPKFDQLTSAAVANDKKAAKTVAVEIMTEAFRHHPGMTYESADDDGEGSDSKSDKRKTINALGILIEVAEPVSPLHRVAARALVFDLRYWLARMEQGG